MKRPNKKKRFKLVKVKRKPQFKSPYMKALFEFFKSKGLNNHKAVLSALALTAYQLKQSFRTRKEFEKGGIVTDSKLELLNEYAISPNFKTRAIEPDEFFKNTDNLDKLKQAFTNAAKECAERLKALAEIELQNQNHKTT